MSSRNVETLKKLCILIQKLMALSALHKSFCCIYMYAHVYIYLYYLHFFGTRLPLTSLYLSFFVIILCFVPNIQSFNGLREQINLKFESGFFFHRTYISFSI